MATQGELPGPGGGTARPVWGRVRGLVAGVHEGRAEEAGEAEGLDPAGPRRTLSFSVTEMGDTAGVRQGTPLR